MRFPDINVWLALAFESHSNHQTALKWFESIEQETIVFCRQTQQGFLRLATNSKAFGEEAVTMKNAWKLYDAIRADSRIKLLSEPNDIESIWKRYTSRNSRSPKLWNDSWLAAFAYAESLELVTFDKGFKQFEGLKCRILTEG